MNLTKCHQIYKEAVAPIQNKVGQFVTSPMIRRVIGNSKSTIAIDDVMNSGKILLANLSQGRLGEDNSALLGAMLITKLQLVAMRRVNIEESERRDFLCTLMSSKTLQQLRLLKYYLKLENIDFQSC